jgi:hypothetical protein
MNELEWSFLEERSLCKPRLNSLNLTEWFIGLRGPPPNEIKSLEYEVPNNICTMGLYTNVMQSFHNLYSSFAVWATDQLTN